ncbi:hypothetical protein A4X13_0g8220 [Tilletia indica]|uniref:Cyclin N-terminal domain-containing protein n=1 Tax=Tilletia indica TaxID=43049 RepID=A0A8T8SFX1_9BASI|nr:hypothetical protein A4X13_0g8220 [Tilletia indica]
MLLHSEILWLAVDIFHRFISSGAGPTISAYHTGLACLWLSAKVEGQHPHRYRLRHFARFIDDRGRTKRRMIHEEAQILAALQFRLSGFVPPPFWVGHISAAGGSDPFTLQIALVLVDTTVAEPYLWTWPPKELAAVAVLVACKMWHGQHWGPAHSTASGFQEHDLVDRGNMLLEYLRSDNYRSSYMYRKYKEEEHNHVGEHVRLWALNHTVI